MNEGAIGERGLWLDHTVKILKSTASEELTFTGIDDRDQGMVENGVGHRDSLNQTR